MQAADSEAKGAQRHSVLTANFLHWSVNAINSNLQQSNVYTCDRVWSCPQITRKRHMGRAGTRFAVLLLLLVKALYGMPDSADRNTCGICMSGAECPLLRNSDEEHDLVAPSKVLDALC